MLINPPTHDRDELLLLYRTTIPRFQRDWDRERNNQRDKPPRIVLGQSVLHIPCIFPERYNKNHWKARRMLNLDIRIELRLRRLPYWDIQVRMRHS